MEEKTKKEVEASEEKLQNENHEELAAEPQANAEIQEEVSDLEKLQSELDIANDKYTRLVAEFDNFRKRTNKERMELISTAGKDVIVSMMDVMDDCDRTEVLLQKDDVDISALKEGMQLVINKLRTKLEQKGVKAFESIGELFDVELHEAITEIPAPSPDLAGKVVDEIEKGYNLNGKLIRHAKVVVGKQA